MLVVLFMFVFVKQKTADEMRISDWSSDVCSSDLLTMIGRGSGSFAPRFFSAMAYLPRMPSNTSAKAGWFAWVRLERAASITSGCGWPCREATMICLTTWYIDPSASITARQRLAKGLTRSEEHTSELQSLMRISYAVFCLKKKKRLHNKKTN